MPRGHQNCRITLPLITKLSPLLPILGLNTIHVNFTDILGVTIHHFAHVLESFIAVRLFYVPALMVIARGQFPCCWSHSRRLFPLQHTIDEVSFGGGFFQSALVACVCRVVMDDDTGVGDFDNCRLANKEAIKLINVHAGDLRMRPRLHLS